MKTLPREVIRLEFHPLAQPVRSNAGWLLLCHAPSNAHELTLLLDRDGTDRVPEWQLLPDGQHRRLLMLTSPRLLRLHFDLRTPSGRRLRLEGMDCTLHAQRVASSAGSNDPHFELEISCSPST